MATADRLEYVLAGRDELTKPLRQAEGQMKRLGNQAQRTNKQMGAFSSNLANANKGTRAFAMGGLQQAGYQIGDFAVQVANGTSKMQAFGQQAPQFLQIFGPIGSVIGAVVAVVAAFGVAAEKSSGASASLSDKVEGLKTSIDSLKGVDKMLRESLEAPILAANAALTAYLTQLRETKLEEVIGNVRGVGNELIAPLVDRMERLNSTAERTRRNVISMMQAGDDPAAIQRLIDRVTKQEAIADKLKEIATTIAMGTVAKDTEELAQNLLDARQTLQDQGFLTKELSAGFDEMLEKGGLLTIVYEKQKALGIEITDGIKQINEAEVYHDSIMRQQNITQSNLKTQYELMVEAQKDRKKFLDDELVVMQQVVKQSGILLTNMQKFRPDKVYGGRGGDPRKQTADYMNQLGYTSVADLIEELSDKGPKAIAKTRDAIIKLSPEAQRMADLGNSIGNSFENAFMNVVRGTQSAKDAFRTMAADIIAELYRVFVVKQITGFVSSFIADPAMFGGGKGPAGSSPRPVLRPKAIGGPVQAGGAYLVGERGPELFRPARSGSITPNDQLGGSGVVVNQTFNFSANGDQSVKQIIAQSMPQIAKVTQNAILDARRRGGQTKQVFG